MGLTGKLILPLFGAVLLCGLIQASITTGYDDVNSLPPQEKRRIIRELLRAQKDIRRALLKVHYSLNGEEFEGDEEDEGMWNGCSDKELAGYRATLDEKTTLLGNGLKLANTLIDEIEKRVKPGHHGHHESGYGGPDYGNGYGPGDDGYGGGWGGGDYGQNGYGPPTRPPRPTLPPLTTTPETTSYRPTTESYETDDDDDDYYARNRGANRRYGRELGIDAVKGQDVKHEPAAVAENLEQSVIDGEVAEALDKLFDDKE
uniref:Uncharacterized protein n=1 Tax=Anopheles atroparvus TaxID=41427 RepID=A0AAG5D7K9_ANOAO